MNSPKLHALVTAGNAAQVRAHLTSPIERQEGDVNAYDRSGHTPLMLAVMGAGANVEIVGALLDHGADPGQTTQSKYGGEKGVMALALAAGDPATVRLLIERGGDVHYQREHGYGALVDAVHGRDIARDGRLLELLGLLIDEGVDLNAVTSHGELGSRVLSRWGRFDAVGRLLDAGVDAGPLRWTLLMRAVTRGSVEDVREQLDAGAELEERDGWERTPFLLAVLTGDVEKARLLRERGADIAARGWWNASALSYAVGGQRLPMLRWLLENGADLDGQDEFGATPLSQAASKGDAEEVSALLAAGARIKPGKKDEPGILASARSRDIARVLLAAGADTAYLPNEAQRVLAGLPGEADAALLTVSEAEFQAGRTRRFGVTNPEKMEMPFWEGMIRAGVSGWEANVKYEGEDADCFREPVWCAQRFGQSITVLPDGRVIRVAGEHEDHYDPDFCIYNDVFVHWTDGRIEIYSYPETVFPPTDFHTATLVDDFVYLIGSLGYHGTRQPGRTPVYRLHTRTLRMEAVETRGEAPGWIYEHAAALVAGALIRVTGGKVVAMVGGEETHVENAQVFMLRVADGVWVDADQV